jgi:hypothetical protein
MRTAERSEQHVGLELPKDIYELMGDLGVDGRAFIARESPEAIRRFRKNIRPITELLRQLVDD